MAFKELAINLDYAVYFTVGLAFHTLLLAGLYRRFTNAV